MINLLLVTRNIGKIREIKDILADIPYQIKTLADIDYKEEIDEKGSSFEENAILKAEIVGEKTQLLTLAEDSGLEVDILGRRPGIYSARYVEGTDDDRISKVLKELKGVSKEKRTARFVAVVAIYNPEIKQTHTFEGESRGYITEKPAGKNGFGYDPIFYNLDLGKTNAEVPLEEKNKVSHRSRALYKAKNFLLTSFPRTSED